jgi:hypothetical protein
VFLNLEVVQKYFQETNKSLENVFQKEREAKAARTTFQKAVTFSSKEEVGKIQKLSISEQVKGDIIIKVWEAKLAKYKRIKREVNDDCQVLSLQETLCGCRPKVLGNLRNECFCIL